jgi:GntR family transcriptional regulator
MQPPTERLQIEQKRRVMTDHVQAWDQDRPIYRQLMEQIVARILDQTYREGEMLPSVRQLASDFLVNPLTAARAYRELEEYTETRRGVGLIVKEGVRELLLKREQRRFLRDEWPAVRDRIRALDLDATDLLKGVAPKA